jgi:hypothetical protein
MILSEIELFGDISKSSMTFRMMMKDWNDWVKKAKPNRPYLLGSVDQFKLAGIDNYAYGRESKMIAAYDSKASKYAAFIQLQHFPGAAQNIFEELIVAADKPYRGLNIVTKMYDYLINEEGLIILSDESHSSGGRHVWEQLAKMPGIGIYGYNTKTKKVFQVDMDDLFNEDVYDTGLVDEIDNLQQELLELEDELERMKTGRVANIIWVKQNKKIEQVKKELANLNVARRETIEDIRLFAARKK